MAESIGAIIQQWLRENNLAEKLQENSVPSYWVEIVGESVAKHAQVERIERGTMFVKVQSAVWRNELAMRRDEIRAKVNERLGAEIVKEIVLR
ncbi:MAG: hypothetical protein JWQ98_928 [Chlorobi bacterium]|nr:hypothetical protein [Chlorobiota bacterium]